MIRQFPRQHGLVAWDGNGWVWRNGGQSPTFLSGQPVAQFGVGQGVDIALASPQGPALRLQSRRLAQAGGPMRTEVAGGGAGPPTNLAAQPGYAAAAAAPRGVRGRRAGRPTAGLWSGWYRSRATGPAGRTAAGLRAWSGVTAAGLRAARRRGAREPAAPGFPARYPPGGAGAGMPGAPGFGPRCPALDQGSFFEIPIPIKSWLHDRGFRQVSGSSSSLTRCCR